MKISLVCIILFLIFVFLGKNKENFKLRRTKNMIYDIRGEPIEYDNDGNPIMYTVDGRPVFINNKRSYPGPFILGLFPYFYASSHYH